MVKRRVDTWHAVDARKTPARALARIEAPDVYTVIEADAEHQAPHYEL